MHLCPLCFSPFSEQSSSLALRLYCSESVIQFYRPVSLCFKTAASQGTASHLTALYRAFSLTYPDAVFTFSSYPPLHPLSHGADAEVMFFIVVEVFGLDGSGLNLGRCSMWK